MEERFSKVSAHYSVYCTESDMEGDELAEFIGKTDTVGEERFFKYDVRQIIRSKAKESLLNPSAATVRIGIALNESGQVVTYYRDQAAPTG
jgi:hypothetical protein